MRIIIVGAGRVGSRLAKVLDLEKHQVILIDKNPKIFERLGKAFKGKTVEGLGYDLDTLEEAQIERADALVSVTNSDNANVVTALIAKNRFQVPKVIARIYDPLRERLYQTLGIQTFSSTSWAANKINNVIAHAELIRHMSFGNGEVEVVEGEIKPQLSGKKVADLTIPGEILPISIIRYGRGFVPTSGTILQEKDGIAFVVMNTAVATLKKLLFTT
ncbi:MAG: TrkA family potassium uptake protein [Actinobacteria bacterium]|nr:MAG: TrkA family potassium uptake protein [Actinomycetota bacterium]